MADEYVTIRVKTLAAEPTPGDYYNEGGYNRICRLCTREMIPGWIEGESRPADRVVLSKLWGTVHADCFVQAVEGQPAVAAWVALGHQIGHRPSRYTASEIRAVIHNLLLAINRQPVFPGITHELETYRVPAAKED